MYTRHYEFIRYATTQYWQRSGMKTMEGSAAHRLMSEPILSRQGKVGGKTGRIITITDGMAELFRHLAISTDICV
jgi:hypothetical protein